MEFEADLGRRAWSWGHSYGGCQAKRSQRGPGTGRRSGVGGGNRGLDNVEPKLGLVSSSVELGITGEEVGTTLSGPFVGQRIVGLGSRIGTGGGEVADEDESMKRGGRVEKGEGRDEADEREQDRLWRRDKRWWSFRASKAALREAGGRHGGSRGRAEGHHEGSQGLPWRKPGAAMKEARRHGGVGMGQI